MYDPAWVCRTSRQMSEALAVIRKGKSISVSGRVVRRLYSIAVPASASSREKPSRSTVSTEATWNSILTPLLPAHVHASQRHLGPRMLSTNLMWAEHDDRRSYVR